MRRTLVAIALLIPCLLCGDALTCAAAEGWIAFYSNRDGNAEIYVMYADGTGLTRLTRSPGSDMAPAISPNGKRIAFVSGRSGDREIYVMDIDGGNVKRLTDSPGYESHVDWSPNGERIAFISERDGNREIYHMASDGSDVVRVTNHPGDDERPDWSPGGEWIAFCSTRDGNYDLYRIRPDGTEETQLTDTAVGEVFPQWSPDGEWLLYVTHSGMWGAQRLWLIRSDGTDAHIAFEDQTYMAEGGMWSPDGAQIVFQSWRGGQMDLCVVNADGTEKRWLTSDEGDDYWADWGPIPEDEAEEP